MADQDAIKQDMWKAMADSPFVMIALEGEHQHSEPMTAQLDPDANGKFWFYTKKGNRIARGGKAMAQFVARGHDLFACIAGTLTAETDPAIIDKNWSNDVAAWYDGGRDDPDLLMLRFDLSSAEIWERDASVKGLFRMLTGQKVEGDEVGKHAEVAL